MYVSISSGKDSWLCVLSKPCQTIKRAVTLASHGDEIYLDGTGTDKHPYTCESATTENPGIYINKSLSLIGYGSPMPQIRCSERDGLMFNGSHSANQMNVTLARLLVNGSIMIFQDSSAAIDGCKFQGNKQSLKFVISNKTISRIQITNSTFSKNRQCIFVAINDTKNTSLDHQVTFILNNTSFIDNAFSDKESCISFTKRFYTDESVTLNVTLEKVRFFRNRFGASGIILLQMDDNGTKSINFQNVTFMCNSPSPRGDVVTGDGHSECIIQSNTVNLFLNGSRFVSENSRLLNVSASNISLHVYNSNFSGHSVKGKGGVISLWGKDQCKVFLRGSSFINTTAVQGGAINIKCSNLQSASFQDSFFLGNTAKNGRGGAVYVYSQGCKTTDYSITNRAKLKESANQHPYPAISISRCNFSNAFSSLQGGAVAICALRASMQLRYSVFTNCTGREKEGEGAGGGFFMHTLLFSLLTVEGCHFKRCTSLAAYSFGGSLVAFYETQLNMKVLNSSFISNYGGALVIHSTDTNWTKKSRVTIENSLFLSNSGKGDLGGIGGAVAILVWNHSLVVFKNVTMESNRANAFAGAVYVGINSTLKIYQSRFFQNTIVEQCGGAILAFDLNQVQVEDSIFDGNYAKLNQGGLIQPGAGGALCVLSSISNLVLNIFNTTFRNCSGESSGGALYVSLSGNLDLKVQSTRFMGNLAFSESGGAVSVVMLDQDNQTDPGCCERNERHICVAERFPSWDYKSRLTFEDTTFESNAAVFGGAVYLTYGKAVFKNCSFIDNFAKAQGGHIYTSPGSASLIIRDSFFNQTVKEHPGVHYNASTASFIHAHSSGNLTVYNTTFDMTPYGISSSIMQITNGRWINFGRDNNLTTFSCPVGSRMATTNFTDQDMINASCKFNTLTFELTCSACPSNSYSLQRGQARGLQLVPGFRCLPCPFGADCCQNIIAKPDFWGFKEHKNSVALNFTICPLGYCRPPYRITDFPEYNGCQGNRTGYLCGKCNVNYTETLYSTHCRPSHECNDYLFWLAALVYVSLMALFFTFNPPIMSWIKSQILWFKHHGTANQDIAFDKGYLRIVFYLYQASNLLLISNSAQHVIGTKFVEPVVGFFNFQYKLSSSGLICPFPGLTVVTKQLFSAFQVFGTLLMVGIFYILHWGVQKLRGRGAPCVGPYVGGVLQTMLLGYTTLASVSFSLLRCVPIGTEKRLFFDGNVVCFCWWQYFLIAFIFSFFVPFVFVLLWGSLKMYNRFLSVGEFLLACCFPLPLLLYWAYSYLSRATQNTVLEDSCCSELSRNSVERVLYDSFKRPGNGGRLLLCWESVMIGRRLILIVLRSFISEPMLRLLIMTLFSVLFLLHHAFAQPFRDGIANILETISLMSVVVLAAINMCFASSLSLAVPLNDHFNFWWEACQVTVETVILCAVPTVLCILVVAAVLSQVGRLTVMICRMMYYLYVVCFSWCCRREVREMRSLLT